MAGPVEAKVTASTAAAAVSGLAIWSLGRYVFKGSAPDVVASWVSVIIPSAVTFMAGYAARHTNRPDALPLVARPFPAEKTLTPPTATGPPPSVSELLAPHVAPPPYPPAAAEPPA